MTVFPYGSVSLADAYTPTGDAGTLLGLLAWCVSAGGVFGLIVIGITMAVQLNRGDPGEGSAHFRSLFFVMLACLVGTTAGPLVAALGDLSLLGP